MLFLTAIFIPPLYFFIKKRIIAGIIHLILAIVSIVCIATMFLIPVALFLWLISASCAIWDLRKRLVEEQATLMAKKMAQALRESHNS